MKVAVLGSGGLLGTFVSKLIPIPCIAFTHQECDITNEESLADVIIGHLPDVVINCAGVTNKVEKDTTYVLEVNSRAPHLIASVCDRVGARLIHISTDCVFSGFRGAYTEQDYPDPYSLYGMSKLLGEVTRAPHLTVRTSFLGYPDPYQRGLLAWASQQTEIGGFVNHFWNGLTAYELAKNVLPKLISSKRTGLIHVYGNTYTKHDVLKIAAVVYGWNYELDKVTTIPINRVLKSVTNFEYISPDLFDMLLEMESGVWWNKSQ